MTDRIIKAVCRGGPRNGDVVEMRGEIFYAMIPETVDVSPDDMVRVGIYRWSETFDCWRYCGEK